MPFDGADFQPNPQPEPPPPRPAKLSKREETAICVVACILAVVLVLTPISVQTVTDLITFILRRH